MKKTVRAATHDDIKKILEIQAETGISFWSEDDYRAEFQKRDSICFCIDVDGIVSGFILIRLIAQIPDSKAEEFSEAEILNLAVSQKNQRNGIGSTLFSNVSEELKLKRIQNIWLEVRESNFQAINFYRTRGFEDQYVRGNYYSNPKENAIVMKKLL